MSFILGQNEQRFIFPFPEWLGTRGRTRCGRGPITDAIAACTDNGIPVLGGFALVLIAGFLSIISSSSLSNFNLSKFPYSSFISLPLRDLLDIIAVLSENNIKILTIKIKNDILKPVQVSWGL